jgi:hypothetical protein
MPHEGMWSNILKKKMQVIVTSLVDIFYQVFETIEGDEQILKKKVLKKKKHFL